MPDRMTRLAARLEAFFWRPCDPLGLAVFRILFGALALLTGALLWPDWQVWFGPAAAMTLETSELIGPRFVLSVFQWLPDSEGWAAAVFGAYMLAALSLSVGFYSRTSALLLFVLMTSLQGRNFTIWHSGDLLARLLALGLSFSPAGARLSVDRLISRGGPSQDAPAFALRMMQLQLCFVYLSTALWKLSGRDWLEGSALFYAAQLEDFRRLGFPAWIVQDDRLSRVATWGALAAELAIPILIWSRRARAGALILGLTLHASLELAMSIPLFEWYMAICFLLFVDPDDLRGAWAWLGRKRRGPGRSLSRALSNES
jgi:hypothetical protein